MRILILLGWLFLAGTAWAQSPPIVGANKFDLFSQYVGTASGCRQTEPCRRVTRAMGQKAIEDAADAGIPFLRVGMTGAVLDDSDERNTLDLWSRSPADFWAIADEMMDDLDRRGMKIVPVLMWSAKRFPVMAGETTGDLIANPSSRSWQLLARFTTEFVNRYKGRSTVLFYELTNELNNAADLDREAICQRKQGDCEAVANFSTGQLIEFTTRFAALVRKNDPRRMVSSGFAVPRETAESLRARPQWVRGGPPRRVDTPQQFAKYLQDTHRGLDIISIHLYGGERNNRFGSDYVRLLDEAKRAADAVNKPLYVGEFGEADPKAASPASPTSRMLQRILELRIPYSSVWAWQLYQRTTYSTHDTSASRFSLEPGQTDYLITQVSRANAGAGARAAARRDDAAPRVVLTWPLECAVLRDGDEVHAVASDDSGKVARVEFWLDDRMLAADETPPYQAAVRVNDVAPGEHVLKALAVDRSGKRSEFSSRIAVGGGRRAMAGCQ